MPIAQINSFYISTNSALTLATEFGKVFNGNIWTLPTIVSTVVAVLTLIVAAVALFNSISANNIAKSIRSSDLLKLFLDLNKELPLDGKSKLTDDHKQLFCNYFDLICLEIKHNRLDRDQIKLVKDGMLLKIFTDFVLSARKKHGNSTYEFYFDWYDKNK